MKRIRSEVRLAAGALLAYVLFSSAPAVGGTIYSYTGNSYTQCAGVYCSGGPYSLSATFETTLADSDLISLPIQEITSTVTSFAFTDGTGLTVTQNTIGGSGKFLISTDSSGNIVAWLVGGYANSSNVQMQSNWDSPYGFIRGADFSETTVEFRGDFGFVAQNPGTWTKSPSPVPIPSALWLAATGIAGIFGLRRRLYP
jgi:hypothetical protein